LLLSGRLSDWIVYVLFVWCLPLPPIAGYALYRASLFAHAHYGMFFKAAFDQYR